MREAARVADATASAMNQATGHAVSSILTAASDILLVLDESGVIRDLSLGHLDQPIEESRSWLGHGWVETVTPESRPRIQDMLREAAADGVSRRHQVNHLSAGGNEIPIAYTAVRLMDGKQFVAVGRDLSPVSDLRQQLVEAQQALEREYWRMRHLESRYRLLFQVTSEAVLVVDAVTQKVVEANPAAAVLFDCSARKLVGRSFPFELDRAGEDAVQDLLAIVRAHGRGDDLMVRLGQSGLPCALSISLARQDADALFLVRLLPQERETNGVAGETLVQASRMMEALPDAFVAVDREGRVISANRAFLDLVEMPTVAQIRGQPLGRWVGRPGADLPLMLATLREHGVVRLFGTSLRGELGSTSEVEISGAVSVDGGTDTRGLLIRDVGHRLAPGPRGARDLTRAVEQLTALVGRVSLKKLARDTAELVERHFIEAALARTDGNRTSAAGVLGVSRQSLYVKLRRYNLGATAEASAIPRTPRPKVRRKKR